MSMDIPFSYTLESLGPHINVCVTHDHKFGTDAFLLAHFAAPRRKDIACDLGTGCGILPMYWARFNAPRRVYAVDIMEQAIEQLRIGLRASQMETEVIPICRDLKELDSGDIPKASCDLVACNPPYKVAGTGIISATPSGQAARHETLCTIYDICGAAFALLRFGGRLCICQRPERLLDVADAMRRAGIEPKRLRFVQKDGGSAPWLFLMEGKKGSRPYITVEQPLLMEAEDGFSREVLEIYGKM